MMMPNIQQIAEIQLFSYNFQSAKMLATQLVTVFRLCSEQIILQPHYDFGMRTVKNVLSMMENAKLFAPANDKSEADIIVDGLRKNISCTLNDDDALIFEVRCFYHYYCYYIYLFFCFLLLELEIIYFYETIFYFNIIYF